MPKKVTGFPEMSDVNRIGVFSMIVLFLLFTYFLIGGYTNRCNCQNNESFQNCNCARSTPAYSRAHPRDGYPRDSFYPTTYSSNIYQAEPYMNF